MWLQLLADRKYYFIDNGILNLFLVDSETSLLENLVAIHLCRKYGKENVAYYNAGNEIDFVVEEAKTAIQVSYDISDDVTFEREVMPLVQFSKKHPDWQLKIITFDCKDTIIRSKVSIDVVPAWLWMIE